MNPETGTGLLGIESPCPDRDVAAEARIRSRRSRRSERIRSAIALPEIPEESTNDVALPRIEIKLASVSARLPEAAGEYAGLQVGAHTTLLTVAGVARYLVTDGCKMIVDPTPGASMRNVRLFLLGSAFGILCHQRGLMPLHTNAIVAQGGAVAFAGHSGAGKSTLAAYFQSSGYEVLCDDVCVLSFDEAGRPLAWPGLPRLKLWRDAASSFGHDSSRLERAVDGLDKFHIPNSRTIGCGPFPLRRIYLLQVAEPGSEVGFARLSGGAAFEAIASQTYRNQYLDHMGLRGHHLNQSVELAKRSEIYAAPRNWGVGVFAREAARIRRHVQET